MFNGYSAAEMKEVERAWHNTQPMKGGCALCKWKTQGTAAEVLEAQKEHRYTHGTEKKVSRRKLRSLTSFRQNALTDDDVAEIELERRRRAALTGVEIDAE